MKTSEEILEEYKQAGTKRHCDLYFMFIDLRSEFDKMDCKLKDPYQNLPFPTPVFRSGKGMDSKEGNRS
jgi:hypothetical protein